jgi:hypothetical protein
MDLVTVIGLIAVAVMFVSGVGLLWLGLRRQTRRLPEGADEILAAVSEGRLVAASGRSSDPASSLSTPPDQPPRAEHATPAVRLVPRQRPAPTTAPVMPTRRPAQSPAGPASKPNAPALS